MSASRSVRGDDADVPAPASPQVAVVAVAAVVAVVAAACGVAALAVGVTAGGSARGGGAGAVLLGIALCTPAAGALAAVRAGRPAVAAGVLGGAAVPAAGQLVATVQVLADANTVTRPELFVPTSLTVLGASAGTWLLLGCYVLLLAAGGAAALSWSGGRGEAESDAAGRTPRAPIVLALAGGALAGVALLLLAPFSSTDPYLPARTLTERAPWEQAGGWLVLAAAVLVPALGAAARDRELGAGVLFGAVACYLQLGLPHVAPPDVAPPGGALDASAQPYLLLAAAVLVAVAGARALRGRVAAAVDAETTVVLPARRRLLLAAAGAGLLAAAAALLAAVLPLIEVRGGPAGARGVDRGVLVPAGVLVAVLAAALPVPRLGALVRPAFLAASFALPLAVAGVADGVVTAGRISGVTPAAGAWALAVALLPWLAAVGCAAVAGGVERDDVDLTERAANPLVLGVGAAGGLAAVAAFGLPVLVGADYVAPGLWSNFRLSSWGLVLGLATVLVGAGVAGFSRPRRGAALLGGAALVVAVHAAALPLGTGRVPDAAAGPGLWACLVAVAALLAAAVASNVNGAGRTGADGVAGGAGGAATGSDATRARVSPGALRRTSCH